MQSDGQTTVGQTGRSEVSTIPQVLRAYGTALKYRSEQSYHAHKMNQKDKKGLREIK